MVISGINPGANVGVNVNYSGTVSAAREGALYGVPAIAASMEGCGREHYADAAGFIAALVDEIALSGIPPGTFLNVNFPNLPLDEVAGVRICRQSTALYSEFVDKRIDPRDKVYYWQGFDAIPEVEGPDMDSTAVKERYIAITPIKCDMTDYAAMEMLKDWNREIQIKKSLNHEFQALATYGPINSFRLQKRNTVSSEKKFFRSKNFPDKDIQKLLRISEVRRYRTGQVIIEQGKSDGVTYYLVNGQVRVEKDGALLHILRRTGDVFGEMSAVDGFQRTASVMALEDSVCVAINMRRLENLAEAESYAFKYMLFKKISVEPFGQASNHHHAPAPGHQGTGGTQAQIQDEVRTRR